MAGTLRSGERWRSFAALFFFGDGVGGNEELTGYVTGEEMKGISNEGGDDGKVDGDISCDKAFGAGWLDGKAAHVRLV